MARDKARAGAENAIGCRIRCVYGWPAMVAVGVGHVTNDQVFGISGRP